MSQTRPTTTAQVVLAVFIRFLIYFVHWMVLAHLPVILNTYGLSDIEIGVLIGCFSLASMFLVLPIGAFSDIFSPKRTIICGGLLVMLYYCVLLSARSFTALSAAIIIGGAGFAALVVVPEALYLKHFGQQQRGKRIATYQFSTYLGFGLGPLAGGYLMRYAPSYLFIAALAVSLAILVLTFFMADFETKVFSFRRYGDDLFQFKTILLIACVFIMGTHFGVEQTSFSLLLTEKLGFDPEMIGFVFAGLGLWMASVVPAIGKLHDKREAVFLYFLCGMLISGIFQVLTAQATGFWSLLAIRLAHTMGDTVALLELSVLTAIFFPAPRLGGNSGLLYSIRTMATFSAALFSGWINRNWGYAASFQTNGYLIIIFVVASACFILTNKARRIDIGWQKNRL